MLFGTESDTREHFSWSIRLRHRLEGRGVVLGMGDTSGTIVLRVCVRSDPREV